MLPSSCNRQKLIDPWEDRRAQRRARLEVKGTILFPDKEYEEKCLVLDLSPDGAGLKSTCSVGSGTKIVLYVDGLGRFEGKIIRQDRLHVGVQFGYSKTTRERIAELIATYLECGPFIYTSTRSRPPLSARKILHSFALEMASGEKQACDIVDITFSGASFKTDTRPAVGERVMFGKTAAVVVRHTEIGFAVSFWDPSVRMPVASGSSQG
jgi:hypothetical protein